MHFMESDMCENLFQIVNFLYLQAKEMNVIQKMNLCGDRKRGGKRKKCSLFFISLLFQVHFNFDCKIDGQ